MKIHLPTKSIFPDTDAAYEKYRELSGGQAEDRNTLNWAAWDIFPFRYPTVPAGHKQTDMLVNMGDYWTWQTAVFSAEELRERFKSERQKIVDSIKVTTAAGNIFDGDEVSQGRMVRAMNGLKWLREKAGASNPTVVWVLADNSVIQATEDEIGEALVLAGQKQAEAWVPS